MSRHDLGQRRQHPRLHLEIRLAPGRLQRRGIGQPPCPVLGKPLGHFLVRQALPDPEVLFTECRMLNDGKPMALRHLLGALRAPAERARVDRPQRGAGQPIGHPFQLGHAGGRQLDVHLPVIRVRSGFEQFPVPNQVQPRRIRPESSAAPVPAELGVEALLARIVRHIAARRIGYENTQSPGDWVAKQ